MAAGEGEVVVYSTPFCVPCEQLKRALSARGVAFRVRDLMLDEAAAARLEEHEIRATPALEVDGAIFAGQTLSPDTLDRLFGPEIR